MQQAGCCGLLAMHLIMTKYNVIDPKAGNLSYFERRVAPAIRTHQAHHPADAGRERGVEDAEC